MKSISKSVTKLPAAKRILMCPKRNIFKCRVKWLRKKSVQDRISPANTQRRWISPACSCNLWGNTVALHPGSKPIPKHQYEFSNLYCLHVKALTSILGNYTNWAITCISQNMSAVYLTTITKLIFYIVTPTSKHGRCNTDKTLGGFNWSHGIIKVKVNLINTMLELGQQLIHLHYDSQCCQHQLALGHHCNLFANPVTWLLCCNNANRSKTIWMKQSKHF